MLYRLCRVNVISDAINFSGETGVILSRAIRNNGKEYYIVSGQDMLQPSNNLMSNSMPGILYDPHAEDIACMKFKPEKGEQEASLYAIVETFKSKNTANTARTRWVTKYLRAAMGCGVDMETVKTWIESCEDMNDVSFTYHDMVREYCRKNNLGRALQLFGYVDSIGPDSKYTQLAISFSNAVYDGVDVRKLSEAFAWNNASQATYSTIAEAIHILQTVYKIRTMPFDGESAEDYSSRLVTLASKVHPNRIAEVFGLV